MRTSHVMLVALSLIVGGVAVITLAEPNFERSIGELWGFRILGALLALAGVLLLRRRKKGGTSRDADIPIRIDSVKHELEPGMARCIYYSVESVKPGIDVAEEMNKLQLPFVWGGGQVIVCQPTASVKTFDSSEQLERFIDLIEKDEVLFVDINSLWLPLEAFGDSSPQRARVYRLSQPVLRLALANDGGALSALDFAVQCRKLTAGVSYSDVETKAWGAWNKKQIEHSKDLHDKNPDMWLRTRFAKEGK
jgi:hypothetical protein